MTVSAFAAAVCAVALFASGVFLLLCGVCHAPSAKTSRAFRKMRRREERRDKEGSLDVLLGRLAEVLSRCIHLRETRSAELRRTLKAAGMTISPEMHVANCLVKALVCAALGVPLLFLFPVLSVVALVTALGVFYDAYGKPEKQMTQVREEIEFELPMFVNRIESMLRHTRDVVYILQAYQKNAGRALAAELAVTVADMQSGNAREALTRMETRIGIPAVSDIARGLSAVVDGNDPVGYWAALSARLTDNRRQMLSRRARAIPAKISRLSFYLLGCIVIIYMTVVCVELFSSLGVLFP